MYLNCLMHPYTLIKHVQFVKNVFAVYSFVIEGHLVEWGSGWGGGFWYSLFI